MVTIMTTSPMPVKVRFQQRGLTLLETILAVAVGAVIIMGVLIYYQSASDSANMTATTKMVGDIGEAVRIYAQSPDYTPGKITLTDLQAKGLLTGTDIKSPWSAVSGSVQAATSGNYLGIRFYNVPAKTSTVNGVTTTSGACGSLATQLSNSLPFPSPGTVKMQFKAPGGGTTSYTYTITPASSSVMATWGSCNGKPCSYTSSGAAMCQISTTSGSSNYQTGTLSVLMDLS